MSTNGDPKHDALNRALIALQDAEYELERAREMASIEDERAKLYDDTRALVATWSRLLDHEVNP